MMVYDGAMEDEWFGAVLGTLWTGGGSDLEIPWTGQQHTALDKRYHQASSDAVPQGVNGFEDLLPWKPVWEYQNIAIGASPKPRMTLPLSGAQRNISQGAEWHTIWNRHVCLGLEERYRTLQSSSGMLWHLLCERGGLHSGRCFAWFLQLLHQLHLAELFPSGLALAKSAGGQPADSQVPV